MLNIIGGMEQTWRQTSLSKVLWAANLADREEIFWWCRKF